MRLPTIAGSPPNHEHSCAACVEVRRLEHAAEYRLHVENLEEILGDVPVAHALAPIRACDDKTVWLGRRQCDERPRSHAPVCEVAGSHVVTDGPVGPIGLKDGHDPLAVGERQWLEHRAIDGAEDRRRCADAEGERERRRDGERRSRPERPRRIAEILKEVVEHATSVLVPRRFAPPFAPAKA
jgi:hypothetical protein